MEQSAQVNGPLLVAPDLVEAGDRGRLVLPPLSVTCSRSGLTISEQEVHRMTGVSR